MQFTRETILLIEKKKAGAITIAISSHDNCPSSYRLNSSDFFLSDLLLLNTLIKMEPTHWSASCKSVERLNKLAPELVKVINSLSIKNITIIPCQINRTTIGVLRTETTYHESKALVCDLNCTGISKEDKSLKYNIEKIFGLSYVPKNWEKHKVSLTIREREILSLFALGETVKSTSKLLCLSHNTVNTHTKNIYKKLCANNRQRAVYKAQVFGLLDHKIAI